MSVVIIFTSVATLRYELAVVLPKTHEEAANVMMVCGVISIMIAALSGLLLMVGGTWLLGKGFHEELKVWLWCVPPLIAVTGIYLACNSWCTRAQEFSWYSLSQVSLPFLTILSQVIAAVMGLNNASGLIAGTVVGQCATASFLLFLICRKYGTLIFDSITWEKVTQSFVRYKAYPLYMTPYTFVGTIRDRLVYFLLANFTSKSILGYYGLSARLVNMPNSLVSSAIRPVFFQKASNTDLKSLEGAIHRALYLLTVCIVPFWILFLFHAKTLFAFAFGEPWREAGLYAAILSVPTVPLLLGNWLDRAFDVLGRQRLAFTLELVFSAICVGVLTLGMIIFKNPVIAVSLQVGVLTFYYSYWLEKLFEVADFDRRRLWKLAMVLSLWSFVCAVSAWVLSVSLPSLLAITINVGFFGLGVGAYLLRQWRELKLQ